MEDDSGLSTQPKWLSYVVISIWLVLTLIVFIVVLSNNPNYAKALELIVQVVSALGGAAAGIAGFLAVKAARDTLDQARADRRAELELKRPQFSAFGGVMGTQYTETRENDDYINLQFVNEGGRPAKDVRVTAFLMDEQLETEQVIRHTEANNVSVNNSFLFSRRGIKLKNIDGTYYLYFRLLFVDVVTNEWYTDTFYFRWRGVPGFGRNAFSTISLEERASIQEKFASNEKQPPPK